MYSNDFREKVLYVYEKNKSLRKTAALLGVSYKFVQTLMKRWKTENTLAPMPHKGGNPKKIQDIHIPFLTSMIDDENDLSLEEMCGRLYEKFNLKIAPSTLCETLARLKISRKKTFRDPAADSKENTIKTVNYLASLIEADKKNFIFIDETGCCLNMSKKLQDQKRGRELFQKDLPEKQRG